MVCEQYLLSYHWSCVVMWLVLFWFFVLFSYFFVSPSGMFETETAFHGLSNVGCSFSNFPFVPCLSPFFSHSKFFFWPPFLYPVSLFFFLVVAFFQPPFFPCPSPLFSHSGFFFSPSFLYSVSLLFSSFFCFCLFCFSFSFLTHCLLSTFFSFHSVLLFISVLLCSFRVPVAFNPLVCQSLLLSVIFNSLDLFPSGTL